MHYNRIILIFTDRPQHVLKLLIFFKPKSIKMKTNTEQLKKAASMIRALNPERLEILKFISDKGETNVRSIYAEMGKEQSVISLNLSILKKAGFVTSEKSGQNRIYSVNIEFLERFNLIISDLCK